MRPITNLKVGLTVMVLGVSSLALVTSDSVSASITSPIFSLSAVGIISATQQSCLNKYEAGPPARGTEEITATFTNYVPGTEVQFLISNPSGGWLTHVIDFVASPSQCNNIVVPSTGDWFAVTIPSGLKSLQIIGLPDSYLVDTGNFQSRYGLGSGASPVAVASISSTATSSRPVTTTTQPATTTTKPATTATTTGPAALAHVASDECGVDSGSGQGINLSHNLDVFRGTGSAGNLIRVAFTTDSADQAAGITQYETSVLSPNKADSPTDSWASRYGIFGTVCHKWQAPGTKGGVGHYFIIRNGTQTCASTCRQWSFNYTFTGVPGGADFAAVRGYNSKNQVVMFLFRTFSQYSSGNYWACVLASQGLAAAQYVFDTSRTGLSIISALAPGGWSAVSTFAQVSIDSFALSKDVDPATGDMIPSTTRASLALKTGVDLANNLAQNRIETIAKDMVSEDTTILKEQLTSLKLVSDSYNSGSRTLTYAATLNESRTIEAKISLNEVGSTLIHAVVVVPALRTAATGLVSNLRKISASLSNNLNSCQ